MYKHNVIKKYERYGVSKMNVRKKRTNDENEQIEQHKKGRPIVAQVRVVLNSITVDRKLNKERRKESTERTGGDTRSQLKFQKQQQWSAEFRRGGREQHGLKERHSKKQRQKRKTKATTERAGMREKKKREERTDPGKSKRAHRHSERGQWKS